MATIAENLQIIKDSIEAIKQAIVDKGGTISGDITTYADAINVISSGDIKYEKSFRILNHNAGIDITFPMDHYMTWREWIDSEYNTTSDFYYRGYVQYKGFGILSATLKLQYASDIIGSSSVTTYTTETISDGN